MAASAGRQVDFDWNGAAILGVREKSLEIAGEPIDVTSDEDVGWRTLLTLAAQNEVSISLSGVTKDIRLKTDWFAGTRTRTAVFTYPNGDVLTGSFFLAEYSEGMPYNDAVTFEATVQSTGVVTFTPYA